MTGQEIGVLAIVALALAYLARRMLRRRRAGACGCEGGCPAAEGIRRRIEDSSRRRTRQ